MSNRHLSRSIVLQSLFEWDFKKSPESDSLEIFSRNAKEFAPDHGDMAFMKSLFENVLSRRNDLDTIITKAAPDWPLDKISIIDRNILRIGLYELLFADRKEVPTKVAINEAIELAKAFGGENSSRFINGVLGSVYKEMGEPGKNEAPKKSSKNHGSDKNLPTEMLVGALVYARDKDDIYLPLVHDVFGHWTLSKGKLESGEDERAGVVRVVQKELGLVARPETGIGMNQYIAYDPEKGKTRKVVKYFLAESEFVELKLGESGGLDDARWFKLKDILDLNFYDDIMPIVTEAIKILATKK